MIERKPQSISLERSFVPPKTLEPNATSRRFTKYALLGLVGGCVAFFTGCISRDFGSAVATGVKLQNTINWVCPQSIGTHYHLVATSATTTLPAALS